MRTDAEIILHIMSFDKNDIFGFEIQDLVCRLQWESAKEFLRPEVKEDEWVPARQDRHAIIQELTEYMEFAWEKANNCRGISALRSLRHMHNWLWLLHEDKFLVDNNLENYTHYGKPQLAAICDHLNIDWKQYDNDEWVNSEDDEPVPSSKIYNQERDHDQNTAGT